MVPAGVALKQHLSERGSPIPLMFTVHLLSHITLPWHYGSDDWCGIKDLPHRVRLSQNRTRTLTYRQVWEGQCGNSLERFGSYEADYVTSVSRSEEHTSELQSRVDLVCRLLLEKKKKTN